MTLAGAGVIAACSNEARSGKARSQPLDALSPSGAVPESITFGITPSNGTITHELLQPMSDFLSAHLGLPIRGNTSETYDHLSRMVHEATIDMGIFSPAAYVAAQRGGLPAVPVATVTRNSSPTYLGCFVARAGGETSLRGFSGQRVAWVNKQSTSGYLYPRELMRSRGLDPASFFANEMFAKDHQRAVQAVVDGKADIAAVASPFVDPDGGKHVAGAEGLIVVAKTRRIPLDCVVVHQRLQRDLGRKLQKALFALSNDTKASRALAESWGLGGFVRPMTERYAEVADVLSRAER